MQWQAPNLTNSDITLFSSMHGPYAPAADSWRCNVMIKIMMVVRNFAITPTWSYRHNYGLFKQLDNKKQIDKLLMLRLKL